MAKRRRRISDQQGWAGGCRPKVLYVWALLALLWIGLIFYTRLRSTLSLLASSMVRPMTVFLCGQHIRTTLHQAGYRGLGGNSSARRYTRKLAISQTFLEDQKVHAVRQYLHMGPKDRRIPASIYLKQGNKTKGTVVYLIRSDPSSNGRAVIPNVSAFLKGEKNIATSFWHPLKIRLQRYTFLSARLGDRQVSEGRVHGI